MKKTYLKEGSQEVRKISALATLVCATVLLTGCSSGPKEAGVGETLEVTVRGQDIDAKAEVTVTDIESLPAVDVQEELQLPDSYRNGTVFLVRYEAEVTEGDYPADGTYGFSDSNWRARGMDDVEVATVQIFQQPEIDNCELFNTTTSEMAAELAAGNQISGCSIFASTEADAQIEEIVYGQKSVSRRGSGNGWVWTTAS